MEASTTTRIANPALSAPAASSSSLTPPVKSPAASSSIRSKFLSRFVPTLVFDLENKGSVARDHLANERTYLAWLRTSLSLASIGIAITQLFRLSGATSSNFSPPPIISSSFDSSSQIVFSPTTSSPSDSPLTLSDLHNLLIAQQSQISQLSAQLSSLSGSFAVTGTPYDPLKYRYLGKPVGGSFIALALLFLFLGTHRYFRIQEMLMRSPSAFPPSRRSVSVATFSIGALVVASFAVILATR